MTLHRVAGVCFWIAVTSVAAAGQQRRETTDQAPLPPASSVIERTYPSGGLTPSRRVQTRSVSDRREIVIETVEKPGLYGTLEPVQEIRTETTRTGSGRVRTRHDLFGLSAQRAQPLLERTESEQEVSADGSTSTVQTTWVSDPDGRLGLKSQQLEETESVAPGIRRSDITLLVPGVNETLRPSERTEYTERQINSALVHHDSAQLLRDVNGRWQATETRSRDCTGTRLVGAA